MTKTPPNQDPVYMSEKEGPFDCKHCLYFYKPDKCTKKEMIHEQNAKEYAKVHPNGCCNYFEKRK